MTQTPLTTENDPAPELSIVAPALNEEDNVAPLVEEIREKVVDAGVHAELIVVDDGSTDRTLERLQALMSRYPWLRPLHRDQPQGQSAAMWAGIHAARGRYVATLDADLQNDPADLPVMLEIMRQGDVDLVQGDRSRNRRDTLVRRLSSGVGRAVRGMILADPIRDTGCSTRVMRVEFARQLPLQFKGMHRFIPVYTRMLGGRVHEAPVSHRPRIAGVAKYGVMNRALVGLIDCFAVRWMGRRIRVTQAREVTASIEQPGQGVSMETANGRPEREPAREGAR